MRFKYKVQQYQTDATKAVTDVFVGQPNEGLFLYLRDIGQLAMQTLFSQQVEFTQGYGNARVALAREELLKNIRKVERRNNVPESAELA